MLHARITRAFFLGNERKIADFFADPLCLKIPHRPSVFRVRKDAQPERAFPEQIDAVVFQTDDRTVFCFDFRHIKPLHAVNAVLEREISARRNEARSALEKIHAHRL